MQNKIRLDTLTGGWALGLPRQLVAGAMDGQVGAESTGVCGPRTEAGDRHATAHRLAIAVDPRRIGWRQCWSRLFLIFFLFRTSIPVKISQMEKLPGGGGLFHNSASSGL